MYKINYSYLRPKKAEKLKQWSDNELEFRERLGIWEGNNTTILPMRRPAGEYGRGGVVDDQGRYVPESEVGKAVYQGYDFTNPEYRDEKVVYCGFLINHWGHFLLEGISRLWYYFENDLTIDKYVFFLDENEEREITGNYKELLQLLNIWDKLEIINCPTTFCHVIVPEPAYRCGRYYSVQFLNIFREAAKNVVPDPNWIKPDKIFLSRSKFQKGKSYEFGLEVLDNFYEKNGYTVVFPEKISLSQLIYYIRNTSVVASTSGTLPHHILFAEEGHKLVILERCVVNNDFQVDVNKMMNLDVTYIDAHVPIYSVQVGGPFIMGYTELLESYAKQNNMIPPDSKYCTKHYWKRCFVKYMRSYKYHYYHQWYVPDWYIQFAEELWEGYQAGEKYYGGYLTGHKIVGLSQCFDRYYWRHMVSWISKKIHCLMRRK